VRSARSPWRATALIMVVGAWLLAPVTAAATWPRRRRQAAFDPVFTVFQVIELGSCSSARSA